MTMILLLILIPLFCTNLAIYFFTLITFVFSSELNSTVLIISMLFNVVLTFVIPMLLIKNFEESIFWLNRKQSFNTIHSFISYIFIFLFGIALIVNSFFDYDLIRLIMGIVIVVLFIYVNILYFVTTKVKNFKLEAIIELKKGISCLIFSDDEIEYEFYCKKADNYKINSSYKCTYNQHLKRILKVANEVIDRD